MLDKILQISVLYDTYGRLLTGKQRLWFELHYLEDMSLAEIAEEHKVTRQAVHDAILRAEEKLAGFEQKLNFLARMDSTREQLARVCGLVEVLNAADDSSKTKKQEALSCLQEVLDRLEV